MRLLNTTTLELHEFFEPQVPPYVILSHRWEEEEVTFKDVKKRRNLEAKGWSKVKNCCTFAQKDGYEWLWMDTCCIDKRSSAELSEAINSMFRWYESAQECYAYLSDVSCEESDLCSKDEIKSWSNRGVNIQFWMSNEEDAVHPRVTSHTSGLRDGLAKNFRKSKWFTRSWTLQELLAPCELRFVDRDWKGVFGSKISLNKIVSQTTGIPNLGFQTAKHLRSVSIAARMNWASRRICTRAEDIAYSLLGIFDVNMPLLYGEGAYKAFLRLQLEILKESDDESIFAWYPGILPTNTANQRAEMRGGLLAGSPSHFSLPALAKVKKIWLESGVPYTMTHKGLAIRAILLPEAENGVVVSNMYFYMVLNCIVSKNHQPLVIRLIRTGPFSFARVLGPGVETIREWDQAQWEAARSKEYRGVERDDENRIYIPQWPYPELMA